MTVKALIFDFDGLLMDTETTLLESWRWEWRRHGLELGPDGFFADHGGDANGPRYAALAAAVGAAGGPFDRTMASICVPASVGQDPLSGGGACWWLSWEACPRD